MTIEEIKALGNEEIGRSLHESRGLCWHDTPKTSYEVLACGKCNEPRDWKPASDYCNDLNAIAEVEKIVIEKVGHIEYVEILVKAMHGGHYINGLAYQAATATARQRAEACLLALQN